MSDFSDFQYNIISFLVISTVDHDRSYIFRLSSYNLDVKEYFILYSNSCKCIVFEFSPSKSLLNVRYASYASKYIIWLLVKDEDLTSIKSFDNLQSLKLAAM